MMQNNTVLGLDAIAQGDADRFGAKAATLARLHQAGYAVPRGFAIGVDGFSAYVAENRLAGDHALWGAKLKTGRWPSDLKHQILDAYAALEGAGSPIVAVRSSATGEDGEDASFAGQHETVLNVSGP